MITVLQWLTCLEKRGFIIRKVTHVRFDIGRVFFHHNTAEEQLAKCNEQLWSKTGL